VFSFNLDNSQINEDVLEMIDIYIQYMSPSKSGDKAKTRQNLNQLLGCFMEIKGRVGHTISKYALDSNFVEKITDLESKLFKQSFSYGKCVKEKIETKNQEKESKTSNPKANGDEEEDDENGEGNDKEDKENSEKKEEEEEENPLLKEAPLIDGDQMYVEKKQQREIEEEDKMEEEGEENEEDGDNEERDSFDKIMDDSDSANSSKENQTKPMTYKNEQEMNKECENGNNFVTFLPRPRIGTKLFFGGQQFYIFFRFYYTLFERLLKAQEIAFDIPESEITARMSAVDINSLKQERYDMFKEILKLYLKENFEVSIYEDSLRCIFGSNSGFLFSLDKIIGNIIKNIPSDDVSTYVMEQWRGMFTTTEEKDQTCEWIKYAMVSQKMR
jgi:hypothetical protein